MTGTPWSALVAVSDVTCCVVLSSTLPRVFLFYTLIPSVRCTWVARSIIVVRRMYLVPSYTSLYMEEVRE